MRTPVTATLSVTNWARAIDLYNAVFGASELYRVDGGDAQLSSGICRVLRSAQSLLTWNCQAGRLPLLVSLTRGAVYGQFRGAEDSSDRRSFGPAPKLLDRVRAAIRARHYSLRTEEAYVAWIRRFILFHKKRHPAEMGEAQINQFLTYLAVAENVAASTQNQALSAILFLYQAVLETDLDRIEGVVRPKKPRRLPEVLTREEVRASLHGMSGTPKLVALLLYGAGLRLLEALRLRVKDIDFTMNQITVRDGKGQKGSEVELSLFKEDSLHRVILAHRY